MAISPTAKLPSGDDPLELKKTGVELRAKEEEFKPVKLVVTVTVFNWMLPVFLTKILNVITSLRLTKLSPLSVVKFGVVVTSSIGFWADKVLMTKKSIEVRKTFKLSDKFIFNCTRMYFFNL